MQQLHSRAFVNLFLAERITKGTNDDIRKLHCTILSPLYGLLGNMFHTYAVLIRVYIMQN